MSNSIGTAIIGFGGIGRLHHKVWINKLEEFELCGIWDIKPERCAIAIDEGIRVYASEQELLEDSNVKLVIVAVPNESHLDVAVRAMNAGKHVICEKPVCLGSEQLEQMVEASQKNNVVFTVNQNRRWDVDYKTVCDTVNSGLIGDVYNIESRVYGSRGIPGDWRKLKRCGGGMVLDWGVHLIDQALMFSQDRKLISIYATLDKVFGGECDDGFSVRFTFEGGLSWLCEVRTNNYIPMPRWYVSGTQGTMMIKNWNCEGEIVRKVCEIDDAQPIKAATGMTKTMAPRTQESVEQLPITVSDVSVADFYRNVKDAIEGKAELLVTADQIRRSMAVIEAVFRSAEENRLITDISL